MTEKVYSEDQKILCLNLGSNEVYTIIDRPSSAYAKLSDDRCSNRTLNENGEHIGGLSGFLKSLAATIRMIPSTGQWVRKRIQWPLNGLCGLPGAFLA